MSPPNPEEAPAAAAEPDDPDAVSVFTTPVNGSLATIDLRNVICFGSLVVASRRKRARLAAAAEHVAFLQGHIDRLQVLIDQARAELTILRPEAAGDDPGPPAAA